MSNTSFVSVYRVYSVSIENILMWVSSQSQSHIATDGQSVSKYWCRAPSGTHDKIFSYYYLTVMVLFLWGRPLWREDGSVCCICCWVFPTQSFAGPSPLVLATVFYWLRFETSHSVASYDSQGHGGGIRPRLHTGLMWVYETVFKITPRHGPRRKHSSSIVVEACLPRRCVATVAARWQKTPFFYCCVRICYRRYLATATVYRVTA
jgi:hypothetical protein